jgi:hypothetical protein
MQSAQTTSAISVRPVLNKQVMRLAGLLLGTGLLLYWFSGGLPAATWLMLLQVIERFPELQAEQGIVVWYGLLLLIVQSLLVAFAWGILLWLAVRLGRLVMATKTPSKQASPATVSTQISVAWLPQSALLPPSPTSSDMWELPSEEPVEQPLQEEVPEQSIRALQVSNLTIRDQIPQSEKKKPKRKVQRDVAAILLHLLSMLGCVGAGAVLAWVTGGLPPGAWMMLWFALTEPERFAQLYEAVTFFTILTLIFQALCAGAAWGILLGILTQEIRTLFVLFLTSPYVVANSEIPSDPNEERSFADDITEVEMDRQALLSNPFEEGEEKSPFEESILSPAIHKAFTGLTRQEIANSFSEKDVFEPADEYKASSDVHKAQDKAKQRRLEPVLLDGEVEEQEVENFAGLLKRLHFFGEHHLMLSSQEAISEHEVEATPAEPTKHASGLQKLASDEANDVLPLASTQINPFDVQSDVVDLFGCIDAGFQVVGVAGFSLDNLENLFIPGVSNASPDADHASSSFVYGDPFDGKLPDVFYHDEDLKRDLREQFTEHGKARGLSSTFVSKMESSS